MCGIFGSISEKLTRDELEKATLTLSHRGPDDSGFFYKDGIGLGHRRLSIIDLEGGHQPMFNEDGDKCIVYNGEIYNFFDLRDQLIQRGHIFSTKSDTEAIIHAYEEWGERCVDHFNGMFAFAIWDEKKRVMFLARDRLGIKPLFYSEYKGKFSFASEMKAILSDHDLSRDLDETALASYFTLSYIPAPFTIYTGIRKLLPGHTLTWKDGKIKIRKYWDLYFRPDRTRDERYFIRGFMDLLQDAVKMRLISDVPLGAFLSGGIDSSAVVALMAKTGTQSVNTFSIGFGGDTGAYLDERTYAQMVARRYATNHREYEVIPTINGIMEKIVRTFDEPFADDSTIPSYFVCKHGRENVTVALSGLGGDENFAGYERYLGFRLRTLYNHIPHFMRHTCIPALVGRFPELPGGHYTVNHMKRFVRSGALPPGQAYFGYLSILSPRLKNDLFADPGGFREHHAICEDLILEQFNSPNVDDDDASLNRALYCDMKTYLPEDILAVTDRMSMHHSLEVRVPFLDYRLVEFCACIPPEMQMKRFQKKYLLKKGVKGLLPREVITHRKQGFVGPMAQWLKGDLRSYTLETLSAKNLERHGLFNHETVKSILDEHFSGRELHDTLIWSLLIFQGWYETYIEPNAGT